MDESKEYIEMCRKTTEIQELWEPKVGDWGARNHQVGCLDLIIYPKPKGSFTWLPRQDQLQDMLKDYNKWTPLYWIRRFKGFSQSLYNSWEIERLETMTMDKLWLMFVMRENFKKKWDGKEWIDSAIFPADSL